MVKVVGNDPSVVKQVTCGHCGAILEYLPCDIKAGETRDWRGDMDIYHYITCPQCKNHISVSRC